MKISPDKIEKYKQIYFKKFNKEIDNAQALLELTALVTLMESVYQHINKIKTLATNE